MFVDRPPNGLIADAVVTDNYEAAGLATRHLLGFGHRRIAHLGDELIIQTAVERRRGFTDAVRAAGLSEGASTSTDNLRSEHEARRAVTELMSIAEPPTALFTSQNLVTIGAIRALRDLGLQHQVAVVGFDDIDLADLSTRRSPSWPRTRRRSAPWPPTGSSRGWTATPTRRAPRSYRPD